MAPTTLYMHARGLKACSGADGKAPPHCPHSSTGTPLHRTRSCSLDPARAAAPRKFICTSWAFAAGTFPPGAFRHSACGAVYQECSAGLCSAGQIVQALESSRGRDCEAKKGRLLSHRRARKQRRGGARGCAHAAGTTLTPAQPWCKPAPCRAVLRSAQVLMPKHRASTCWPPGIYVAQYLQRRGEEA
jgi:hypothetical protein